MTRNHLVLAFQKPSRRVFVQELAASTLALASARRLSWVSPETASRTLSGTGTEFDLQIGTAEVNYTGERRIATIVNGQLPAPLLRWREGDVVTLRVSNHLTRSVQKRRADARQAASRW